MKQALGQLRNRFQKIASGGGAKSIEKQHEKNKLTARERIAYLIDENTLPFMRSALLQDMKCMKNMVAALLPELLRALVM